MANKVIYVGGGSAPALTGDAAVGDVTRGKTFYKDDANTKLTGTRPPDYWQYLTSPVASPKFHVGLSGDVEMNIPLVTLLANSFDAKNAVTSLKLTITNVLTTCSQAFRSMTELLSFEFVGSSSGITNFTESFYGCWKLVSLLNIDATACTTFSSWLIGCAALVNFTAVAQTINAACSFSSSPLLSNASLVNIANALKQQASPLTLTLHATAKTNWNAIRGTISGESGAWVFTDDDGTDTLATFIDADHKNWTLA